MQQALASPQPAEPAASTAAGGSASALQAAGHDATCKPGPAGSTHPSAASGSTGVGAAAPLTGMMVDGEEGSAWIPADAFALALSGKVDEVVEALERDTSLIDAKQSGGLTLLHCAASQGHAPLVQVLLDRGAPYTVRDQAGATAQVLAARGGHAEVVTMINRAKGMNSVL